MAKTSAAKKNEKYRKIDVRKVQDTVLSKHLTKCGIKFEKDDGVTQKIDLYLKHVEIRMEESKNKDVEWGECTNCGAHVEADAKTCPVCGSSDEDAKDPGAKKSLVAAEAEYRRVTEEIRELLASGAKNYWHLGKKMGECFNDKTWKKLRTDENKPVHKDWNAYCEAEFGISGTQTRTIVHTAERFTEADARKYGPEKLRLLARIPEKERKELIQKIDKEKMNLHSIRDWIRGKPRVQLEEKGRTAKATAVAKEAAERRAERIQALKEGSVTCVFQTGKVELPVKQLGVNTFVATEELVNAVRITYTFTMGKKRFLEIKRERIEG